MDQRTSPVTLKQRLWDFLGTHLLLNALTFIPLVLCTIFFVADHMTTLAHPWLALPAFLTVAAYFPLGAWRAKRGGWGGPGRRDGVLATVLPAAVSILCVACVLLVTVAANAGLFLLFLLFFAPQLAFWFTFVLLPFSSPVDSFLINQSLALFALILAALLPPLLFTLGSYWQSKRQAPPQP